MCISYPCVDEKGSPIMRSHFIDELQSLFEDVAEEYVADDLLKLSEVQNTSELAELLCSRLGRDAVGSDAVRRSSSPCPDGHTTNDGGLAALLGTMHADGEYKPLAERVVSALSYENRAALAPDVAKQLFGHYLRASATRLATFAACPYKHFVKYVLDLQPRREFKLEPLDLGLFYHGVLDSLHKRLTDEKVNWADIENDRLVQVLREQIAELAGKDVFLAQFVRRSAHNAFIIESAGRVLEECTLGLCQMVRAGSFRPLLSEVELRASQVQEVGRLGRFELPLPDGRVLSLDGKIDRLGRGPH